MEDKNQNSTGQFEFKAEMKQLLRLIAHSLYSHPEIFIRELVSNSSDALNKLRFRRLTESALSDDGQALKIEINVDKDSRTFTIEDTGIGMTKDELVSQLGTIASSGTLQFLAEMKKDNKTADGQLIGQFGVGFYSVFMVTNEVTVETLSSAEGATPCLWKSAGEENYTIEPSERTARGTKISFVLKEDNAEYSEPEKVKSILKKYSNFVDFPIYVNGEQLNSVSALWHRKKEDIKEEELNDFYKFISNDYAPPMKHLQLSIEGNLNFKALLFIPESAPPTIFRDLQEKSLQLYSSKIFIMDDCKDLLPDYLKFVRGVIDTEDLPLNVSREFTQSSPVLAKIKNVLTSKLLSLFEEMAENEKENYDKFFKNFGSVLKLGVNTDYSNKDKIINLLRFESSKTSAGEFVSLKEYVSKMNEEQKEIYYVSGNFREMVEKNPNLEYFRKKDIEVLYLTDPVDLFTIPYILDFEGKQLKSIDKADIDLSGESSESEGKRLTKDLSDELVKTFKNVLGDLVEDVTESARLVDSAATLVVGKFGFDPQMEKMMQIMDKDFSGSKRILEINPAHPLIINLSRLNLENSESEILKSAIISLYEGAMLNDGYLKNPADYVRRMNDFMEKATKI